jgi:L-asparagine permease
MLRVRCPLGSTRLVMTGEDVQAGDEAGDGTETRETDLTGQVPGPRQPGDATPPTTGDTGSGEGYAAALSNRQVQMIAMGGAIGVGLFLGAGSKIAAAGPGLVFAYALAGVAAFFVMRALGELVLHRPTSGSFVEYAREFIGEWAAFTCGWMYWLNWAATGVAEITAVGIYVQFWAPEIPRWVSAMAALVLLLGVNLVTVRLFGELEFWFAAAKVTALVIFIIVAIWLVSSESGIGDTHATVANLTGHGGLFPKGFPVVLMSLQAVVFAYAGIEMVGIAAGETSNPRKVVPRAINGVVWRIAIFYCGSILLLVMVLPWTYYSGNESPFVTVFARLGLPASASIMNAVVLTAALSSTNSGLYSTGRILRCLAQRGEAPRFTARMSRQHVPYGGVLLTCSVYAAGVLLNLVVPSRAFDIATAVASLGVLVTWTTILVCQVRMRSRETGRSSFRMPLSPASNYFALAILALVAVLMPFAGLDQAIAFACIPVLAVVLVVGWRRVRASQPSNTRG